jgi:hypothetical protein
MSDNNRFSTLYKQPTNLTNFQRDYRPIASNSRMIIV